jgi:hypothetical protein
MTGAMIYDKKRSSKAIKTANSKTIGNVKWKAPSAD